MLYSAAVTIPANTTESNPHEEYLEVCFGHITQVSALFPAGHAGLTHLQIFYQTRPLFPTTPGQSLVGDGTQHTFNDRWPIFEVPAQLVLRAWNLDETYEHTIYVDISVLVPEILVPVIMQAPQLPKGMFE